VKNPKFGGRDPKYSKEIMRNVFGADAKKGPRFAPCHPVSLLDHVGTQVRLIGAHSGDGKVNAVEKKGRQESLKDVYSELALDCRSFPCEAFKRGGMELKLLDRLGHCRFLNSDCIATCRVFWKIDYLRLS